MKNKDIDILPSKESTDKFVLTLSLIVAICNDMREFAKKKPDGIVNKFKVSTINRILDEARIILAKEPGLRFLDVLNDEELPQYSDIVIILGQYIASLNQFENKYYLYSVKEGGRAWKTAN